MAKAIKIGNRDDILHRMKLMYKLVKSCSKDATFLFTYEIAQLDSSFMKKAEKFNQKLREYEQKQAQKQLKEKMDTMRQENDV